MLSVRGVDTSWFSTVAPLAGAASAWTYTKLILKRRDKGLSDATNLTISMNGLLTPDQIFNLTVGSPGESSFKLNCYHDGTNGAIGTSFGSLLP